MTDTNKRLRTVTIDGEICSVAGLENLIEQFDAIAHECDSASHEVAAIAMRWAVRRIMTLEGRILNAAKFLG